ncbi:MAG: hypothetical protein DMF51_02500 [Acidobacteria bacterium]|nr:MAG: hypothetical protein DMF51_02500 [Acidobacteriota bacterium]
MTGRAAAARKPSEQMEEADDAFAAPAPIPVPSSRQIPTDDPLALDPPSPSPLPGRFPRTIPWLSIRPTRPLRR